MEALISVERNSTVFFIDGHIVEVWNCEALEFRVYSAHDLTQHYTSWLLPETRM